MQEGHTLGWTFLQERLAPDLQQGRQGFKARQEDMAKIVRWLRSHPDVACSPLKQEAILAPPPAAGNPVRAVEKSKLPLWTSARQLHSDLFKPETGLPDTATREGGRQSSDAVFRSTSPPQLREMSKCLKEVRCRRRACEPTSSEQDVLDQQRRKKRHLLRASLDELPEGRTTAERDRRGTASN